MANKQPQEKDEAPEFHSKVIGGEYKEETEIKLSDFQGETIVLYFYPKDDTPGCTTQACGLRDSWKEIKAKAKVFGVSVDPIAKHQKFIDKYELPFPLISDENKELVESYGVWVEKSMYGKKYMGTERTTFVIGPDQKVKAVFPKVKPAEHLDKLLKVL